MKKSLLIATALLLCLSLFGCGESEQERALREAREAQEYANQLTDAYEDAQQRADNFRDSVNDYYNALNNLN